MLDFRDVATVDFETLPIEGRPDYPPPPVGVALRVDGKSEYLSWGHVIGRNNSTWEEARRRLLKLYASGRPLLFHNAKFDVDVGETHMGLPVLPWDRYNDTLPMLFLKDPDASTYALKPSAERILGRKQSERDAVEEWLLKHQPLKAQGIKLSPSKNSDHYVGAFIAYAPAELVAKYAIGDVDRTHALAAKIHPELVKRKMIEAYDRERRLLPVVLDMERRGLRVNVERLRKDVARYGRVMEQLDAWLCKRLRAPKDTNWNSPDALGAALVRAGEARLRKTKMGKWEVNKEALAEAIKDKQILHTLKYRAQLATCLKTFMRPWLATALRSGGLIFTSWTTTRIDRGDGTIGARTGRIQSTPNFQNMTKEFEALFREWEKEDRERAKTLPRLPFADLPQLPRVRGYVVPYDAGHILLDRDYSQQEPRNLAHYEDGALKDAYLEDPWIDFHDDARLKVTKSTGREWKRKPIKAINLGLMYGMGKALLAEKAGTSIEDAILIKKAILKNYPGLPALYADMRERAKAKKPIRTWGGREHYCEPPKLVDGRFMTFDYKLVNKLIQGSSADQTKEAMIRLWNALMTFPSLMMWLLLTVHDELVTSAPKRHAHVAMKLMKECMESIELDVPMLSEGSWSDEDWASLEDYDKRGERVAA